MTRKMRIELGLLKVGEVAREAQVLNSTVRYYTEIGLLKVREMTDGGYRLYDREETLQRLSLVRQANEGYLSLREIKAQIV
jgi:DNA-binding transcriptional MerR regulator